MKSRYVLGISAFYHDSAACLVADGTIVSAAQEERFSRTKGDDSFPSRAVDFCLSHSGIAIADLDAVVFYDKPLIKFERILETYLGVAPRGFPSFLKAGPLWIKEKLYTDRAIRAGLGEFDGKVLYAEHHESHAASAFYPSPFEEAAILTIDGVGEWATASIGIGKGNEIELTKELQWPDSLGLLYSAFTYQAGFKVNSGEYKVMGLAPYGEPKYVDAIYKHLIDLREDGSFVLDQKYFNYLSGLTMTSPAFDELFGGPPRVPESPLTQREMDLARSVQVVCEEIVLRMARAAHNETGADSLCLAGGVALNAVANGRVVREGPFKHVWIQPSAGDAGGAPGAALLAWHRHFEQARSVSSPDGMSGALLGPSYDDAAIERDLREAGAVFERVTDLELITRTAQFLSEEQVVGWFQGRMEFGPRALGARSILADPRSPRMQALINLKVKFREGFRPFAPSVLEDRASDYFDLDGESPYMLVVAPVKEERRLSAPEHSGERWGIDLLNVPRSDIPAVTHLDYSARIQTVTPERTPLYHALITEFDRITGCPLLVNTSFNVRGEPIVCSPTDAYRCFMRTHLDYLVIGSFILSKKAQPDFDEEAWQQSIPLD
ncbi:MAG TPA: carbamoyltransferase [Gemmatimonadaceae bacterium]|nr:carbamoyltransferase [Gemmatimonadaceae bacterium]